MAKADEAVKLHAGDLDSTPVSMLLCDPVQLDFKPNAYGWSLVFHILSQAPGIQTGVKMNPFRSSILDTLPT